MSQAYSETKRSKRLPQALASAVPGQPPQTEPAWAGNAAYSLPLVDAGAGRDALLAYFHNTWALTETLFSALVSEEAYYVRPYHKTRHPLIFYYVHPVSFYVNKLLVAGLISEPINKEFEALFETGVDEMSWDDLHEGEQEVWPSVAEAQIYRQQVYTMVCELIETHPAFDTPITMEDPGWALIMCFEHERIHLETSSVLIRELPLKYLRVPNQWPSFASHQTASAVRTSSAASGVAETRFVSPVKGLHYPDDNPMIAVAATEVQLGKPRHWPSYGWDNEYGSERRDVPAFQASERLISNGEFYEFVSCGAYLEEKYWSEAGWQWRRFRNTRWPTFWVQDGPVGSHQYRLRTLFEEIPMQWDWPAIVNFYEAKAYCSWLTEQQSANQRPYRLLLEKEHVAMRDAAQQQLVNWQPRGGDRQDDLLALDPVMADSALSNRGHNLNLRFGSEGPVEADEPNEAGFRDVFGNVWQWCEDAFHPLQDFEIHPYYVDFSMPCFDGEHQMILGGSFISTGDEASVWARFHFRPHFFQHAGFRVVQGEALLPDTGKLRYESDVLLNQYLLFHYGSAMEQRDESISQSAGHPATPPFMETMASLVVSHASRSGSVLDLGCAVGRASFELARHFEDVVAVDYSDSFIAAAQHLQQHGQLDYERLESGRHTTTLQARVESPAGPDRLQFMQGDAGNLQGSSLSQPLSQPPNEAGRFDAVLMSNLLCRLPDPAACLAQFVGDASPLAEGGILVLASPNTWMEQYTPAEKFLDAPDSDGAVEVLASLLPGFELLHQQDLPFMIREHRRKYEYVVSHVTIWRRKL
ncbi:5-histidylcysteine sulfoxide synthase [Pseudohongiella nitratireducens]|uniref:5-histidylcysteine sulfoxide synthase n=1 Tax=Pseudohongiella nitratireducens TaxID=1768907 RepID=UPI0030EE8326